NRNRLLIECDHGKDEDDSMVVQGHVQRNVKVPRCGIKRIGRCVLLTNQQETLMPGQKRKMGSNPAVVLAETS
ncbi:hypothetical protein Tco_0570965, partial [Tanacetum coccineum]